MNKLAFIDRMNRLVIICMSDFLAIGPPRASGRAAGLWLQVPVKLAGTRRDAALLLMELLLLFGMHTVTMPASN